MNQPESPRITSDFRRCPRHAVAMEVNVIDQCDAPTQLKWWCADCCGYWSENYFAMRAESELPVLQMTRNFQLACPVCKSHHTSRNCDFDCCDEHRCNQCGEIFHIEFEIIRPSNLSADEIEKLKRKDWLDYAIVHGSSSNDRYLRHDGARLTSLLCDIGTCSEPPLILVSDLEATDERFRFGWLCPQCNHVAYDYLLQSRNFVFKEFFSLTDKPDFRCRVCHHCDLDQSEGQLRPVCRTCGTAFQLNFDLSGQTDSTRPSQ